MTIRVVGFSLSTEASAKNTCHPDAGKTNDNSLSPCGASVALCILALWAWVALFCGCTIQHTYKSCLYSWSLAEGVFASRWMTLWARCTVSSWKRE